METKSKYKPDWGRYSNLPELHQYLKILRERVFSKYDIMVVGEVGGSALIREALNYCAPEQKELDMVFNFDHNWCNTSWKAKNRTEIEINVPHLREMFSKWQQGLQGNSWNAIYWLNHDQPRVLTHYGDDEGIYHDRSAKALACALYFMWGTPFIYNGEEIGMTNPHFKSIDDFKDISFITQYNIEIEGGADPKTYIDHASLSTRDNARTLMQWDDSTNGGFSKGKPWNIICDNYKEINVLNQLDNPDSILNFYRTIIELRTKSLYRDVIIYGTYKVLLTKHQDVYAYIREYKEKQLLILCNLTKKTTSICQLPYTIINTILKTVKKNIHDFDHDNLLEPYEAHIIEVKEKKK